MATKIKQISLYLLMSLITIIIYGTVLYFVCKWLAGYSLLHAYLGNIALIIITLAIDELMLKTYQPEKLAMRTKKEKDVEKGYRNVLSALDSSVSFKTDLYLFYVFVLVASKITEYRPALAGDDIGIFLQINSYSILLLVAIDMLIGQFAKDRERIRRIKEKFKEYFSEGTGE